jgi:molybdate transport system substrate-binding protein
MIVFAAASLRSTFEELGEEFESEHDGVDVQFNFGWLLQPGGPDPAGGERRRLRVADTANMDKLVADGLVTEHGTSPPTPS